MKLPKTLKIGSMYYSVKHMSQDQHEMSNAVGLCAKAQNEILIYPDMHPSKVWSTLLHETYHAKMEEAAIPVNDHDEEMLVSHLERVGCSFIVDNWDFHVNLRKVLMRGS